MSSAVHLSSLAAFHVGCTVWAAVAAGSGEVAALAPGFQINHLRLLVRLLLLCGKI